MLTAITRLKIAKIVMCDLRVRQHTDILAKCCLSTVILYLHNFCYFKCVIADNMMCLKSGVFFIHLAYVTPF